MPPENTLFPGFDGGPGEVPPSTDITGVVLPSLSSDPKQIEPGEDYQLSYAANDVSVLPEIRNNDLYDSPPQPIEHNVAVVDTRPHAPAPQFPRLSLDDRIALIQEQAPAAQNLAEQQLMQLTDALIRQGQQIEALSRQRSAPLSALQETDPVTGGQVTSPLHPTPSVSADDIEDIVTRAIQNYDSQLTERQKQQLQMQSAQEAAFARAAQQVPGLNDPQSQVHQTFLKVWNRSPLRHLPDGPVHVALQVQGLLASEAAASEQLTQRKRQASPTSPAPTATDVLDDSKQKALQQEYARTAQLVRAGSKDADTLFRFRKLGRMLGRYRPR